MIGLIEPHQGTQVLGHVEYIRAFACRDKCTASIEEEGGAVTRYRGKSRWEVVGGTSSRVSRMMYRARSAVVGNDADLGVAMAGVQSKGDEVGNGREISTQNRKYDYTFT
ncbi:hypothetical protein R3P38DRAFT_2775852 [Favolaschia claudopus]|uniref:Uncharacterized protein n=1 Tax=Favolaschia claudopus TaxID=2862362 RepID=A0AAW0BRJ1_9AGAR